MMVLRGGIEPAISPLRGRSSIELTESWNGSRGRIRTSGFQGHYSWHSDRTELRANCSFEKRQARQVLFKELAIRRDDAERHSLPGIWGITLDDQVVRSLPLRQRFRQQTKRSLVLNSKSDRVGSFRETARRTSTGGVNQLGCLSAFGDVGADDAVVRQVGGALRLTVNVSSCGRSSHISNISVNNKNL